MTLYTFSIDFPRWKVLPYDSFRSKVVLLAAKRNMLRDLRDHSERFKWSREQAQNLSLHIFSHNYHNYSMFRDVPGCSGMFRDVPCSRFYRRPNHTVRLIFFARTFGRETESAKPLLNLLDLLTVDNKPNGSLSSPARNLLQCNKLKEKILKMLLKSSNSKSNVNLYTCTS